MPSDIRWVQSAVRPPHRCGFVPFVGVNDPGGFFVGGELDGLQVYASAVAVRDMAARLGWVPGSQARAAEGATAAALARVAELEAELADANRALDAVDVLESREFTRRKRPGRPKSKTEEGVAA